jgi:hypothetical protein
MTRTFADMTPAECAECVGRWADWRCGDSLTELVVIEEFNPDREFAGCTVPGVRYVEIPRHRLTSLTPRLDLPRAWTPSGEPVPGDWEERTDQDGIGDYIRFTRQRRFVTDWEVAP